MLKQGFKVIVENIESNPQCPHGPSLIFQRLVNGQPQGREFFACSAYRDRKDCRFFMWRGQEVTPQVKSAYQKEKHKFTPDVSFKSLHAEFRSTTSKENGSQSIFFCHSCSRFVNKSSINETHRGHVIESNIASDRLKTPTKFLRPLEDVSKEAQYFFTETSLDFLKESLTNLNAVAVISVGTPRLVEHLHRCSFSADVLLLDLDWRYGMFYERAFCWYNMFNHHFLGSKDDPDGKLNKSEYLQFLQQSRGSGSVVIVMDPPFGGRVEALAATLQRLARDIRDSGSTHDIYFLWVYPYFMESYITSELPGVHMLDYKVNYTNHSEYNTDSRRGIKYGSPVRVFTNAPATLLKMPSAEGYRLCAECERYVAAENRHCALCDSCTSKDGRTYVHCEPCGRCVKPTWRHCSACSRCCLPQHKCIPRPSLGPRSRSKLRKCKNKRSRPNCLKK